MISPFQIPRDPGCLADLNRRLTATRWNDAVVSPDFGFSDRPTRPYQVEPADLYPKLMTALGHDRFMVSGTDVGSGVATRIALHYPDCVIAAHVSAIAEKPRAEIWDRDEGGYGSIQSSKPQSLAFALADSPAGLASWNVEKFRNWSDCEGDVLSVFPP
jgi:pimeloyl-ACP methyl ester carboxylesterase